MTSVLMTGATGYLGRHLMKKFEDLNWEVEISNSTRGNLLSLKNLKIFDNKKFDYIFHLAALAKAGDYPLTHTGEQWEINQLINTNALKYWRTVQPQAKMICMGTSCSYAKDAHTFAGGLKEENYLLGQPDEGLYTYAMTKRILLTGLRAYEKQYGLKWSYFIPSTLYGPNFDLDDTHFVFDLIRKIYAGKTEGANVELWGDGNQKRELVFIDDAADIMTTLRDEDNEVYNIGAGIDFSIKFFANTLCTILDYDPQKICYNTDRYVGVREKKLNVQKVKDKLPDYKWTSLQDGLKRAVEYYVKEKNISNW